ncbi:LysR family transcriptional regulator [Pseudomonas haemolytica]|uniref:LysR family transcriptional regulator n=1 Tax=Pseudomonas haemolytica TaxID=2600065 RepID=A0A5P1DA93_9PSED|nr:LysR family transcriptional regulator [Pseudomonas haemolytica]MBJ2245114.1 LysR family transcriptional regulator [Pseudomonas haemolytica]MBJ2272450.1 LysR family transcriptional regulator [Pseudomonas haemolytica]MBK3446787.1 LysR family transcriptional regulator [Pseudomonas haemolytica]MBK3458282.1 LysR family transcriptional regulator [Pseudomonas haemolytica]MRJ36920.1 LysR family transcriptional regulator [Pseudomonas haemolytica]
MDRFHEMQVFLAVAEEQGFAAAARRLNTSPPSVTRAIAAMEQRIGTQLLARTTRSLHLTEAGQRYLEDCRRILAELDEAEEAAAGSYSIPCGHLAVTAPVLFGELFVAPVLGAYLDQFPLVNINALLVDRVVNMTDEGVDVAVRIGHLHDPGQQAIKVGEVRRVVCAAPGYLDQHGRPSRPEQLRDAKIVSASSSQLVSEWTFVDGRQPLTVPIEPRLVVTANNAAINLARLGWGMTRVLSYQVAAAVAAGELELVLETFEPEPLPIQVVFQKSSRVPAKVLTFVDFLAHRLGQDAALNPALKLRGC